MGPDPDQDDPGHHLRPDDRLPRQQAGSPGRVTLASGPCTASGTRSNAAGRARWRSRSTATPAWRPVRAGSPACRSRCCVGTGHQPARPYVQRRRGDLPLQRRDADRRGRPATGRRGHSRPARRPPRQRAVLGDHGSAEGVRAGRLAVRGHGQGGRRRTRPATRGGRAAVLGGELRGRGPGRRYPSYALGYSVRDNDFYVAWDAISRDRETFTAWLDEHVYASPTRAGAASAR